MSKFELSSGDPLLFVPMGLTLSAWLCGRAPGGAPPPSAFLALASPASSRLALTLNSSPVGPGDGRSRWSPRHLSPNFLLSACGQEATRSPAELSSDGVRAEMGVRSGLHVWELAWSPEHRGSHAVVGISRQDCPLQGSGYKALVGGDSRSWGWELKTNQLWHGGCTSECYPGKTRRRRRSVLKPRSSSSATKAEAPLLIPERVLLVLDADAGTLGFVVDGSFLGVAFKDLPSGVELFPAVSSVRGGASVRLRYLNGTTRDPPALMALCGLSVRQYLGHHRQNQTDRLPLPPFLQQYLLSCS
ncbi:SPRY domain-containing SOCS box protein 2 isoform X2 [Kryptolebias marmoratus]|uniref:SPRY domain-containing SOCS box protein 2 isoform X2 n=1 Tax=Kryptolebias marmoratus TaxID=37003 RepID=UPI000D530F33|nr:SPRY domain-containing SOCS box protein 2 isoform X2 [Kryptolebias marmoratus]